MEDQLQWAKEPDLDALHHAHSLLTSDALKALNELEELAKRGSLMSMVYLGDCFRRGRGIGRDITRAEHWFRRAYDGGSLEGLCQLGSLLVDQKRYQEAEEILSNGVSKSFTPAMDRLASLYLKQGDRDKVGRARALLEQASALGNVFATRHLAGLLLSGRFGFVAMMRGFGLFCSALQKGWSLSKTDPFSELLR